MFFHVFFFNFEGEGMGTRQTLPPFHILVTIKIRILTGVLYFRGIHMTGSNNWTVHDSDTWIIPIPVILKWEGLVSAILLKPFPYSHGG